MRTTRFLAHLGILAVLGLLLGTPGPSRAQNDSHYFGQTGHTVRGAFWQYWQGQGGLAQQGYPISEEMQEKSPLNGQIYTVQYFERAVFELHPENQPPYNVLLSQLGTFRYKAKYPGGAPGQTASTDNAVFFPQTQYNLGDVFRQYWGSHGGLTQQGYPISDEFTEVSDLNGQSYKVQYFERAVFEYHPENKPPYDLLLSQLGTFRYRALYQAATPPSPTPVVNKPTPPPDPCADIPPSQDGTPYPNCVPRGGRVDEEVSGFKPGEMIGVYLTGPDGQVIGAPFQVQADDNGRVAKGTVWVNIGTQSPLGIWANSFEGTTSHHKSILYFKVLP